MGRLNASEDRRWRSAVVLGLMAGASASAADIVGLITKTETNPFFVKMREGAEAKAKELGVDAHRLRRQVRRRQRRPGCRRSRT